MTEYMTMEEAFKCGDKDIPFIEGVYNITGYSKKQLMENPNSLRPTVVDHFSDQWQVQRMYLCQGCGKYFRSEDCESISGVGTFNCDKCNHPSERKVLTGLEEWAKYYDDDRESGLHKMHFLKGFDHGEPQGRLAEWLRPEQVEFRKLCHIILKDLYDHSDDRYTATLYVGLKGTLKNLNPPSEHTEER